uniref:Polistes-protonectin n=1 Tax=Polistes rothneyi TaxID=30208 RepID=PROT_POLRT|nr:RecName: Full=Polistes-protonectin [Polistes rothneyi]
ILSALLGLLKSL